MGIPISRIRDRKLPSSEQLEAREAEQQAEIQARAPLTIDQRFALLGMSLVNYRGRTENHPDLLALWPVTRSNLKSIVDYVRKNRGKIPDRFKMTIDGLRGLANDPRFRDSVHEEQSREILGFLRAMGFYDEK